MSNIDRDPSQEPSPEGTPRVVLASFLLAVLATTPALLLLGLAVLPRLARLEAAADRMETLLARIEGAVNLTYFSRDPSRGPIQEALAHLQFWTDQETKARAFEVPDVKKRQEMAISALSAAGPANLGLLEEEALRLDLGPGSKYYRRGLLRVMTQIDPRRGGELAARLLTEAGFDPQSRLFAAEMILEATPERGAKALRRVLESNDHLSMEGYPNLLGIYIHLAQDQAKGVLLRGILGRPTLDLATVMEVIKGIPALPRNDPAIASLGEDLQALYLTPDAVRDRFRSAILLRPHAASLLPTVRLEIVRALGQILPRSELAAFLDRAEIVETDQATLGTISRIRQEQGI